ncbi:DUF6656 family protein [Rhizobium halophytocola]|uniref:Uncharacterized protein n=1 Tax=Rhizobium halophytocola TaxID=735519 RepID=A0ABS4DXE1_9HYPH|nr:DUF6656 family protein [Rhizobium halophytocola]MBP1850365.1 hypothetical protein [Rhizobium halophytocola]
MTKLRYYEKLKGIGSKGAVATAHSEFLRTGQISRRRDDWLPEERRYLTYEEVAERTGRQLALAAETSHERINAFHRDIRFPKIVFHRVLKNSPHLGYCHVTASRTTFAKHPDVNWSFYIANFAAEIGDDELFFETIEPQRTRMYFAVAITPDKTNKRVQIDRSVRENGVLFVTRDPNKAIKNILKLGAPTAAMRAAIDRM